MSCSTDIGLQTLKLLENKVKGELAGFTSGAGGLTGNLSTLQSKINLAKEVSTALTTALPSLEGLIPSATLISEMGSLVAAKNNPAQFAAQLLVISQKYVNVPGVDIQSLASSILSGEISADNICAQIPNVIVNKAGDIIKKGIPPIPPTTSVKELISTTTKTNAALSKKLPMISNIPNVDIKSKVESFSSLQAPQSLGVAKDITTILPTQNVKSMSSELTVATSKMGTFTQKAPISSSPASLTSFGDARKILEDAQDPELEAEMIAEGDRFNAQLDALGKPIPGAVYDTPDAEDTG